MSHVVQLGCEHDFGIGGEIDLSHLVAAIRQRDPADLCIVFRGDDNFLNSRERAISARPLSAVLVENDFVIIRLYAARLEACGPDRAAIDVTQENV